MSEREGERERERESVCVFGLPTGPDGRSVVRLP